MNRDDRDRLRRWKRQFSELDIESPLSHPLNFKKALQIGEEAYTTLMRKRTAQILLGPLVSAVGGAGVASSPLVAAIFFPAGGILGWLGLATAATPVGWVIAVAVLSGAAWTGIDKMQRDAKSRRGDWIPKWINTPLDLLALCLFFRICPLAVKLAAVDGEIHERERAAIERYFVKTWGYDERFVKAGIDWVSECEETFDQIVKNVVGLTRSNPDCNAEKISEGILEFLYEVAEAVDGIVPSESDALEQVKEAFTQSPDASATIAARVKRRLSHARQKLAFAGAEGSRAT